MNSTDLAWTPLSYGKGVQSRHVKNKVAFAILHHMSGCVRTRAGSVLGQHFAYWTRNPLLGAAVISKLPTHDAHIQAAPTLILDLKSAVVAAWAARGRPVLTCLTWGDAIAACCSSLRTAAPPAAGPLRQSCQAEGQPRPHCCKIRPITGVNAFHRLWQASHTPRCMSVLRR